MRILTRQLVLLLAITLTPQFSFAAGDPPLTVSNGGSITISTDRLFSNEGVIASGDGNTINITSSGSITAYESGILADGQGQTVNNQGTIEAYVPVDFCSESDGSGPTGDDVLINSGSIIEIDPSNDVAVKMGWGDDTVSLLDGSYVEGNIIMSQGNDRVMGTGEITGNVVLGPGNDLFMYNGDVYGVKAGDGNDIVFLQEGAKVTGSSVSLAEGNDTLMLNGNTLEEGISGGPGNDLISGTGTINGNVSLGSGNDTFNFTGTIGEGLHAASGNDVVTIGATSEIGDGDSVAISLGEGTDTLNLFGSVLASKETSILIDGDFHGGPDDDTLVSRGNVNITGDFIMGTGDDTLHIQSGTVVLESDVFRLNYGEDTLIVDSGATLDFTFSEHGGLMEDNDTAHIYGTVTGELAMGPDDDVLHIYSGANVADVCGGSEEDILNFYGSGTFDSNIEYFEIINKHDDGIWKLTEDISGSDNGIFTVFHGGLIINGDFTVDELVLNSGTTLGGIGYISGNIDNSGSFAPGNSIGTFSIGGDYTQTADGRLVVEIGDGATDELDVGGDADLDGELNVQIVDKIVDGDSFTFLTATNVYDEFNTVTGSVFYDFDVVYSSNDASLEVTELSYAEVGLSADQAAFIDTLKEMAGEGDEEAQKALLGILNQDTTDAAMDTLGSLTPEQYPSLIDVSMAGFNLYSNTVMGRMGNLHLTRGSQDMQYATSTMTSDGPTQARIPAFKSQAEGWSTWARIFGMTGDQDEDNNIAGYEFDTYGLSFGFDNKVNDNMAVGIGGGFATTDVDFDNSGQDTDVDSYHVGVYSTYSTEKFYIDTALLYADNDYDSKRRTSLVNAKSSTDGTQWGAYLGGGLVMVDTEKLFFIPTASLEYAEVDIDGFTEKGTGLLYSVDDYDADSVVSTLGVRFGGRFTENDTRVEPEVRLAWAHEYGDTDRTSKSSFVGSGTTFSVNGVEPDSDSILLGVGANFFTSDQMTLYVDYDGEFSDSFHGHTLSAGLRYNF